MTVLRSMLFVATIAGLVAGVAMTLMQYYATVPLILEAETYESAPAMSHVGMTATDPAATAPAEAEDEEWQPSEGFQRMALTAVANLVTGIGFALLLVAASEFAGGVVGWRQGLLWGLAAFAVFTVAPTVGLRPGMPGMPVAPLAARQAWWLACVLMTGGGLALIAFGRTAWMGLLGAALLVLPHLIGAPQPPNDPTSVPADLHQRFVTAATVTGLAFWMVLGTAVGLVRPRFADGLEAASPRLA